MERVYPWMSHAFHLGMGLDAAKRCWNDKFAFLERHVPSERSPGEVRLDVANQSVITLRGERARSNVAAIPQSSPTAAALRPTGSSTPNEDY